MSDDKIKQFPKKISNCTPLDYGLGSNDGHLTFAQERRTKAAEEYFKELEEKAKSE